MIVVLSLTLTKGDSWVPNCGLRLLLQELLCIIPLKSPSQRAKWLMFDQKRSLAQLRLHLAVFTELSVLLKRQFQLPFKPDLGLRLRLNSHQECQQQVLKSLSLALKPTWELILEQQPVSLYSQQSQPPFEQGYHYQHPWFVWPITHC